MPLESAGTSWDGQDRLAKAILTGVKCSSESKDEGERVDVGALRKGHIG